MTVFLYVYIKDQKCCIRHVTACGVVIMSAVLVMREMSCRDWLVPV